MKILLNQLPSLYDLPSKILVLELLEKLTAGDSLCRNSLTAFEYKTPSKLHPEVYKLKEFFPDHLRKVQLNLALFHPPELDPKPISLEELERWRKEKNTNGPYYHIIVALITQYKKRFEGTYSDLTMLWMSLTTNIPLDQAKLIARSLAIAYTPLDQSQILEDIAAIVGNNYYKILIFICRSYFCRQKRVVDIDSCVVR
jgi:hypothetical protein